MKMLIMALLLAAQGAQTLSPAQTEAFQTVSRAWAQCTKRYVDRTLAAPSPPADGILMDRALAACTTEEAAVRTIAAGIVGEDRASPLMERLRQTTREAMGDYLRRTRPAPPMEE
jgi:hypothetical protein